MRAVRGIGQGMEAQREAGLMAKGGNPTGANQYSTRASGSESDLQPNSYEAPKEPAPITLEQAGIDKHLADKARKFAARTEEFETFAQRLDASRL